MRFIGSEYSFLSNHKNLSDRIDAAKTLIEMAEIKKEHCISIYCDTMNNQTNHFFRASPERLYVLDDEKVVYQGEIVPFGYSIPSLDYLLTTHIISDQ